MKRTNCKNCGAPIAFIKTDAGRWMPVNIPALKRHQLLPPETLITNRGDVIKHSISENLDPDMEYFRSHFATCPAADSFRKPR